MGRHTSGFRWWWAALPVAVVAAGAGWYVFAGPGKTARGDDARPGTSPAAPAGVPVEVVHPKAGGIERTVTQPGTAETYEGADLYSKVSGFLAEQTVDIGTRVKKGQLLARISVPEYDREVERNAAKLGNARAKVEQAKARVTVAEADARAAQKMIGYARSEVQSRTAARVYHEKQYKRIQELNVQQAVDARVADEKQDQFEASQGAELASRERVGAVEAQAEGAAAKIIQAKADLTEAVSEVAVAQAELDKSRVWQEYELIKAPSDGVVTKRTFLVGDFVRAADGGAGHAPVLAVERTDVFRVVVPVPDRDVPYTDVGDEALVQFDALPGKTYKAVVSRFADAEDPGTRTMRTEVDVPNTDGKLRRGMYGVTTLVLQAGAKNAVRVPSAALVTRHPDGTAEVRVVRDGKAHLVTVVVGQDNGIEVEVTGEVSAADRVITRAQGAVAEGTAVRTSDQDSPGGGH